MDGYRVCPYFEATKSRKSRAITTPYSEIITGVTSIMDPLTQSTDPVSEPLSTVCSQ